VVKITLPIVIPPFTIDVGEATHEGRELLVYQVLNTETGVLEAETSSLARAIVSTRATATALEQLLVDDNGLSLTDLAILEQELDHAEGGVPH